MSEDKTEGREVAPSVNPEERPNLEDYKSKDKASGSASNVAKTTDFDSVTTVPTPEGDLQVETKLEIPVEDNKEDIKSEAKSPKVKKSSEEEPQGNKPILYLRPYHIIDYKISIERNWPTLKNLQKKSGCFYTYLYTISL
jgi:hypothetical protein